MDDTNDREVVNNSAAPTSSNGNEYDDLARNWMNVCMLGVATTNATASCWLHLTCAAIALHTSQVHSTPTTRGHHRRTIIQNITKSEKNCKEMLRLSTSAFESLLSILKSKDKVKNYCRGSIEEQLITFLLILAHNFKNRVVSFLLCRSSETISRYFHNILVSVITLEDVYIKPPNGDEVQPTILKSHRFFPYFKDCLGAIDGTHVRVKVSQGNAPRYRGRKDWPTQNVLAACTFDMKFTYILAGWEGSAADSRVLQSALTRDEPLFIPNGKFYLGDAGFGLTSKLLTPYGRTRYHLKEYSQRAPASPEELFNHRHSSLRNAIERAFGVLKKRFPIIASGSECHYSCATMTNIILACGVLHNFLLSINNEDIDTTTTEHLDDAEEVGADQQHHAEEDCVQNIVDDYTRGQELRARIASEMWAEYSTQRASRANRTEVVPPE